MPYDACHRWAKVSAKGPLVPSAPIAGPPVPAEIRHLIREMSTANPLWGAPRIHGELLKLGIDVGQTTVAKYMAKRRGPPSQGWKTFLRNHADGIASMDLFLVPTVSFRLLYCQSAPERGMDRPSTNGGIWVAASAALPYRRP